MQVLITCFGIAAGILLSALYLYAIATHKTTRNALATTKLILIFPLIIFFNVAPFMFTVPDQILGRLTFAFLTAWLMAQKTIAWCFGVGPVVEVLQRKERNGNGILHFVAQLCLPIVLQSGRKQRKKEKAGTMFVFLRSGLKLSLVFGLCYLYTPSVPLLWKAITFNLLVYLMASFIMDLPASLVPASIALEAHFNEPYLSSSLADFWGRRWNLCVSSMLRSTIYDPVKKHFGPFPGVMATFFVSGVAHVQILYYTTGAISGEWLLFFLVHGVLVCVESLLPRSPLPQWGNVLIAIATMLITAEWLFYPPVTRMGVADAAISGFQAVLGV